MRHSFDPSKRQKVLEERGLDLADAEQVFEGFHLTRRDDNHSDDEDRSITLGRLGDEIVLVVWAPRSGERRIITMWKANAKERQKYQLREQSG